MEGIINQIGLNNFITFICILNVVLILAFVICIIKISKVSKKYNEFIKKLSNGKNIEEDLENYLYRVDRVEKQNAEIIKTVSEIDKDFESAVQKVGIYRYNAYDDTGSDLSFTLALLDEKDNGIILNGIYSREMSNIYAKPIEHGQSKYTLSEEEKEAIKRATMKKY